MRAGLLRHRITIEQPVSSTGGGFGASRKQSFEDYKSAWAAIWPLRGTELLQAQQMQSEVTTKIRIRYMVGVTPRNRVRLGDSTTYYDIVSVTNPDLRNIYLDMMCKEQV